MNCLGIALPGPRRLLGLGRLTSTKIIRSRVEPGTEAPKTLFLTTVAKVNAKFQIQETNQ